MTTHAREESGLLEQALQQLRILLGEGWDVAPAPESRFPDRAAVAVWGLRHRGDDAYGELTALAATNLSPSGAIDLIARRLEALRERTGQATLVVSRWLSPRTREVLASRGFGFLDLTGNVLIRQDRPAIFIKTQGLDHDPAPQSRTHRRGLSGARAGRLVRQLVDFGEPRRGSELAAATGLSEGYVSRLLESMSDEALIRRTKDRFVIDIDWRGLLRARAASYQLLKANHVAPALARRGRGRLLDALRAGATRHPVLATGSLAAQAFAPTAVGGALMLYVPPGGPDVINAVAKDLALLRIDQSADADVLLLQPTNEGPLERPHPEPIEGIACVGLSQLVLDCLSGPGRMPAEGEAVLAWMERHEHIWRRPGP